jgi:hypothetical protein
MKIRLLVWPLLAVVAVGCGRKAPDKEPPFATPSVSINHEKASLGSPIEVTYRFAVLPDARPLTENYRVFAHFLDADSEMMWADDHPPSIPTSEWKPGQTIQYTRTVFVPIYPYTGEASVEVGLYSKKGRVTLAGTDRGQKSYTVATLRLLPQSENVFVIYKDGWHATELAAENAAADWQWTKKEATITFQNPKRSVLFYLHLDRQASAIEGSQIVSIRVGDQVVDTFSPSLEEETIRKVAITAAQLGTGDTAEIRLSMDKTFVPALVPALNSKDRRELGIRVYHAFIEPQ